MQNRANIEIIIQTVDKTTKETKNIGKSLGDLGKEFAKIGGIVAGVGATINKAMDFGKQGAQAKVLSTAFRRLGGDLDTLRKASRGTVSDFELMNSTNTLLIGTSGELQKQLVANAPRLMEIAKAASTLNPALGDTTFLYESLARGIKRSSPLILDNLGLTIKVGEANERYAQSVGKTVDQLTAQETQLALLQEVMRSGEGLIGTAGGIDTSEIDNIERMEAAFANFGQTLKEKVAGPMATVAEGFTLIMTFGDEVNRMQQEAAYRTAKSADGWDEYAKNIIGAALAAKDLSQIQASNLMRALQDGSLTIEMMEEYIKDVDILSERELELYQQREAITSATKEAQAEQLSQIEDAVSRTDDRIAQEEALNEVYKRQSELLQTLYGDMSKDWVGAAQEILEAISFIQGGGQATVGAVGAGEKALAATLELDLSDEAEAERLRALIATHTENIAIAEIKRQQAMGDMTYRDAYNELYEITGNYEEAADLARDSTYNWNKELEDGQTHLENIVNWVNYLLGVDEIRVKAIIDVDTVGSGLPVGPNGLTPLASGGKIQPLSLVGEQGPEMIINGTVIPADTTKKLLALGIQPGQRFASGGPLIDGLYTPEQMAAMYGGATTSSQKKASDSLSYSPTYSTTTDTVSAVKEVAETTEATAAALAYQGQANVAQVSTRVATRIEQSNQRTQDKLDELINKVLDEDGAIRAFRTSFRMGG